MAGLIGYIAYIAASLALGIRLLLLWRRTRELPELTIGIAFVSAGAVGFSAWLLVGILTILEASPTSIKYATILCSVASVTGVLSCGIGMVIIYRPGNALAKAWVACVALGMAGCMVHYSLPSTSMGSMSIWYSMVIASLLYIWGAIEAIGLSRMLQRRARLGLADPLVADRALRWGYSCISIVAATALGYGSRVIYGFVTPEWTTTLMACFMLAGAGSIWFGFFPPSFYRARIERAFAVE